MREITSPRFLKTMPSYQYQCKSCTQTVEVWKNISADHPTTHKDADADSTCDGTLDQVLFAPAIRFIGKGFHVNDYKKK